MPISTNSVIHYTDSLENIKGILKDGFRVRYCAEKLVAKEDNFAGAYAMVSFCDIPLSETKNHLDSYGSYGIGLSKSWAKEKGLNPVLYIDKDSSLGVTLIEQAKRLLADKGQTNAIWKKDFVTVVSYTKNYDGNLIRGGVSVDNYKFYNEREWRFVPTAEQLNGTLGAINQKAYFGDKDKHNENLKSIILSFTPADISYIIVKKEEETIDIIKHLREIFADKCTATQLEVLMTRITTVEHIVNDF